MKAERDMQQAKAIAAMEADLAKGKGVNEIPHAE
jgi:hypothetical protein